MVLKVDQDRIKSLLTDAITVLCKNGLSYKNSCCIQGLLGITLDDEDVFLVDLKETISKALKPNFETSSEQVKENEQPASSTPPQSPRSGAARRRRKRSNSDNADSPAKRSAYEGEEADTGDVIVIKEEVDSSQMSGQTYDDGGEGNGEHIEQDSYALEQGQEYGYSDAENSQWDTSLESSWHQQQMSQYEVGQPGPSSFAAVAARSTSSQIVPTPRRFPLPVGNLKSMSVRNIFTRYLVAPALESCFRAVAVRMTWFNESQEVLDDAYKNLAVMREQVDNHVIKMPGSMLCLSAITATKSAMKKDTVALKIYPGVAYFILMDAQTFNQREVCSYLQVTEMGLTTRLLLQPYQQASADLEKSLWIILKDTMEGGVRKMVDYSAEVNYQSEPGTYPIAKVYTQHETLRKHMEEARKKLAGYRFQLATN